MSQALTDVPEIESAEDDDLLSQTAHGCERAFVELYNRHSRGVYNYLLHLIHEQAEAEQLLQDVFFAVWQKAGSFRGKASVKSWIFGIAHHQAVDWLRKLKPNDFLDEEQITSVQADTAAIVEQHFRDDEIWRAVANLRPHHRAVLILVFVYGMSYRETADVVGCPLGTVKSRLNLALKSLGRYLLSKPFDDYL